MPWRSSLKTAAPDDVSQKAGLEIPSQRMESGEYSAFGLTGMLETDRDHPGSFHAGSDIIDGFILIF